MLGVALMILGALVALALGVWLGLPGRYTQSVEDIEKVMESGGARRRRTKRVFTPFAWMQRKPDTRGSSDRLKGRGGSGFRLEAPDDQ
jgi:hypothetical protein